MNKFGIDEEIIDIYRSQENRVTFNVKNDVELHSDAHVLVCVFYVCFWMWMYVSVFIRVGLQPWQAVSLP